jgi:hypothetical protein
MVYVPFRKIKTTPITIKCFDITDYSFEYNLFYLQKFFIVIFKWQLGWREDVAHPKSEKEMYRGFLAQKRLSSNLHPSFFT